MNQEKLKEQILIETTDLFMRYGIRSVTMDDIAQHLSISKKTLYKLFDDKEEIIMLVMKKHFQMHINEMENIHATSSNSIEELHKISRYVRKQIKAVNSGVIYDLQKYYKSVWNVYLELNRNTFFKSILKSIKWGIKEGNFRKDIDPEILAILRIEEVNISFDNIIYPEDKYNLSQIHEQLYNHFVYGILTPKGLDLLNQYKLNNK